MPSGPFGGPRITELPPFSSDDVEVGLEEERDNITPLPREARVLVGLLRESGEEIEGWERVRRRVTVRQSPDDGPFSIINQIKDEVSSLGERAATITYFIFDEKIGYIHRTEVGSRFRREGVGSQLRLTAIEDMKSIGVDEVYSFPTTSAGRMLAQSQGFAESEISSDYLSRMI